MHTPTHAVVNLAVLQRPGRWWAVLLGAVLPDLPAFVLRLSGTWPLVWRTAAAALHSFPIGGVLLAWALWRRAPLVAAFAASLLLHAALDFPVHHGDALRQLWPLSDYRFQSPLSYWDPAYYAVWVRPIELALSLLSSLWLWRRHPSLWLALLLFAVNALLATTVVTGRPLWAL